MVRSTWPLSFRKSTVVASIRVRGGQPFLRGFYGPLRYEPCPQFINVSQRALHIYWQFSAMSHAIHKIVSKERCQSYFISRRSPHLGISKDSESCASAHRCLHYAYARLIARVTFHSSNKKGILAYASDCRQNAFGQHSRSVFLVLGSKSVYLINNKHFWVPLFPFLAIIFASFFRFMQANVSPTFISIRAFPIICV